MIQQLGDFMFAEEVTQADRKTLRFHVRSRRDDALLGRVMWFARWRQYTFVAHQPATFNPSCLRHLADFCERLTREHREKRKAGT